MEKKEKKNRLKKLMSFIALAFAIFAFSGEQIYAAAYTGSHSGTSYNGYSPYSTSNPNNSQADGVLSKHGFYLGAVGTSNTTGFIIRKMGESNSSKYFSFSDIGSKSIYVSYLNVVSGKKIEDCLAWLPFGSAVSAQFAGKLHRLTYTYIIQIPANSKGHYVTFGSTNNNVRVSINEYDRNGKLLSTDDWHATTDSWTVANNSTRYLHIEFKVDDGNDAIGSGTATVHPSDIWGGNNKTYFVWEPFKLALDHKGGTSTTNEIYERYGAGYYLDQNGTKVMKGSNNKVSVPTKTGYVFAGYYSGDKQIIDKDGKIAAGVSNIQFTSDTTLTAHWTPNTYKVEYDGNGANGGSTATSTHTYGTASKLTANGFTKTHTVSFDTHGGSDCESINVGQKFKGWNTQAGGGGTSYIDQASVSTLATGGTTKLYAQWDVGKTTLPSTSRTGYTFNGWYTAGTGGTRVGGAGNEYPSVNGNIKLHAQWTPNTYKVEYDGNGANGGSTATSTHTYGTASKLTANGFTKTHTVSFDTHGGSDCESINVGQKFKGWNTQAGGGGTSYIDQASVSTLATGGTTKLYAQWDVGKTTLPSTSRTGYTFNGWYTAGTGGTRVGGAGNEYPVSGNIKLHAQWSANKYTVTYDKNSSDAVGSTMPTVHTYDISKNLALNGFTRSYEVSFDGCGGVSPGALTSSYVFMGWNTTAAGTGTSYINGQSIKNMTATDKATIKLYARWNPAAVTLPAVSRAGYTFMGWYTAVEGGSKAGGAGDLYTPTKSVTLYARWASNTYIITLDTQQATDDGTTEVYEEYGSGIFLDGECTKRITASENHISIPERKYRITYDGNGNTESGSITPGSVNVIYTFGGYYTDINGAGIERITALGYLGDFPENAYNKDTTLYAKWTPHSVELPKPVRPGFYFLGWYTAKIGGTHVGGAGEEYTPISDITLYARWKAAPPWYDIEDGSVDHEIDPEVEPDAGDYITEHLFYLYQGQINDGKRVLLDYIKGTERIIALDYAGRNITEKMQIFDDGGYDVGIPGDYIVKLSVTDDCGHTSTLPVTVRILRVFPDLIAEDIEDYIEGQYYYQNVDPENEDSLPAIPIYSRGNAGNCLLDDMMSYAWSAGHIFKDGTEETLPGDVTVWGEVQTKDIKVTKIVYHDEDGNAVDTAENPEGIRSDIPGKHTVTLSVTNRYGNTTVKDYFVTFLNNDKPAITGADRYFFVDDKVGIDEILKKVGFTDDTDTEEEFKQKLIIKVDGEIFKDGDLLDTSTDRNYEIEISYRDNYGKATKNIFTFHVKDIASSTDNHLRYISREYLHTLKDNSSWKNNPVLYSQLEATLDKTGDDAIVVFELTPGQVQEIKEFSESESPSRDKNFNFLRQFAKFCTKAPEEWLK